MKEQTMLFIYPDTGGNNISFSPAIEILSAFLEKHGVKVKLIHLHDIRGIPIDHDKIYENVKTINPDVIGITSTTYQYDISNEISGELKKRGIKSLIILGGIHATISHEDLESSCFDAFCIGEGELPLAELFRRMSSGGDIFSVHGFHFKQGNRIIRNTLGEIVNDLNVLPFRNYEIMNVRKLLKLRNKWLSIAFSRGCPYTCNFCINQKLKEMHKNAGDKYFRCQSVNRALNELISLAGRYGEDIQVFNFDDDLLIHNRQWFLEFASRYYEEIYKPYGIMYAINGRANLIDEEIVETLKKTGCYLVRVGFETGNEGMRNLILGKKINDRQLYNAFNLFGKYRLRSLAFAMLGIPGETEESIQASLNMLSSLKPTLIRMAIFEPFVGTPLYEYCRKNRLIKDGYTINQNCFEKSSLEFHDLPQNKLILYHLLFPWYLNVRFVGEYSGIYEDMINKYSRIEEEQLNSEEIRRRILQDDKEISFKFNALGISHFEYFSNNNFYYHLADGTKE